MGQGIVNGEPALLDQTIIQRQINRGVSGMLAYPFSQTARVEFGGGFMRDVVRTSRSRRRLSRSEPAGSSTIQP